MTVELSDEEFQDWKRRLNRHFDDLHERFGTSVLEEETFKAIASYDDDLRLCLRPMRSSTDVIDTARRFMTLATPLGFTDSVTTTTPPVDPPKQGEIATPLQHLYSTVPFQGKQGEIRLIELLPGSDGQPIKVRLFVVDNVTNQPYEALSYVWGSREHDVTISVNGMALDISLNLADALHCLRSSQTTSRILWIDAICINQASNVEKASQVALMGDIYRAASEVVVFLGRKADDSDLVIDYLELDDPGPSVKAPKPKWVNPRANTAEDDLVRAKIWLYKLDGPRLLRAAHSFFARAYWSRIWVVQESGLAKHPAIFYCGQRRVAGERLLNGLGPLSTHLAAESSPVTGDPAVSLFVNSKDDMFIQDDRRCNILLGLLHSPYKISKQERPSSVLIRLARRQSTDPRDQVYAMRELVDGIMRNVFLPDYKIEPTDLFTKLTAYLLVCDDSSITYSYFALNGTKQYPSWALNFTLPFSSLANGQLSYYKQKASWMKELGCLSVYNEILGVSGTCIDSLETIVVLEDITDDFELFEKLWNLENLLRRCQPSEPLSKEQQAAVPSAKCCVPLDSVDHLTQCLISAAYLPGKAQFDLEVAERLYIDGRAWDTPRNVTCETWHISPIWFKEQINDGRIMRRTLLYMRMSEIAVVDTFFAGAAFDLENLKQQIMSVQLSAPRTSQSNPKQNNVTKLVSLNFNRGESSSPRCPRTYDDITEVLRLAKSKQELIELQKLVCLIATKANKAVKMYMKNSGSPAQNPMKYEGLLSRHLEEYRNISRRCTCLGSSRQRHRERVEFSIDNVKKQIHNMKEEWRKAAAVAGIQLEASSAHATIYASQRKVFSAVFVTRHGFIGMAYQKGHGLKAGDSLVVLDGIPTPLVLENCSDGIDRMKSAVHVVGLVDMNMSKLVELGVFKRKDFKIM